MKTTKPIVLLALVLLTAAAVQPAEAMEKAKISDTRTASCLVKITSDPAVLPLSDIVIDYLLHSSGVAGKAAREVLNISPDQAPDLFSIEDVAKYSASIMPGKVITTRPTGSAVRRATAAASASGKVVRRTAATTTTPTTRPPALPGGSRSGYYEEYYRKPKPTSGRSTGTTAASPTSAAEQTFLFKLQVELGDEDEPIKPAAEEFMNALIANLRKALRRAFDEYRDKFNNQYELTSREVVRTEAELVHMQKELRNISGSRNLSRSLILQNISDLRTQLQDIITHQASQEIYIQTTTDQIAETQAKVARQLQKDPITIELQRIVDIQTDSLKRTQELVKEGAVSSAEVDDVLQKLARARIELAKRREQISKSAGGNKLDRLNTELAEYSLNMAQNKFSISNLEKQIAEAQDFLAKADTYEVLSLKADIAKQSLQEALLWHARLGRNIRSIQPPVVTVLGGS